MFASPIDVPTVQRLVEDCPRVAAIKDSSGDLPHMMRMIAAVRPIRPDFYFLTGWDSVLECLKISDAAIRTILDELEKKQGALIIVGDHGSVDDMTQPNHSFNNVPIFIVDFRHPEVRLVKASGDIKDTQADVAATILHMLGIDKPQEMTRKSLLPADYQGSRDRIDWQIILDGFGELRDRVGGERAGHVRLELWQLGVVSVDR